VQRELKGRLVDLDDVEHSLDDTIGYLQQVETDLHQLDQVYGDPHFIDAHINRVQVTTATFYMVPARFRLNTYGRRAFSAAGPMA